jgi:hypothetical protein
MCFCLRQANRLIPNRFSFPLSDRGAGRQRGAHDLGVEEEGLLSNYSDVEDEDDAEVIEDQQALRDNHSEHEEEEEEEEFGTLQHHSNNQKSPLNNSANKFDLTEEEDDELYYNPYKDDHPAVKFNNNKK